MFGASWLEILGTGEFGVLEMGFGLGCFGSWGWEYGFILFGDKTKLSGKWYNVFWYWSSAVHTVLQPQDLSAYQSLAHSQIVVLLIAQSQSAIISYKYSDMKQ